jgi:hypothetical protein
MRPAGPCQPTSTECAPGSFSKIAMGFFSFFPNSLLTRPLQVFKINLVAVPATLVSRMPSRLPRPVSLRSRVTRQLALCALVFFFANQVAYAGFSLRLESSTSSSSQDYPAKSPDSNSPVVKQLLMAERDAHTGSASGQSFAAGPSFAAPCGLAGAAVALNAPEPSIWLLGTMHLRFPPPIPSSIFHPPRQVA